MANNGNEIGDFQWIQLSHPLGYPVHAIEAAS
jgi:hypothetical protein